MKKQLILLRGLPASGKSTWAKEFVRDRQDWIRISNDDMRLALFCRKFSRNDTKNINAIREELIDFAVKRGLNIVIDCVNLHPKHENNYSKLAAKSGYSFEIKSFFDVPIEECIRRDALRENKVGKWVIVNMYNQFVKKPEEPELKVEDIKIAKEARKPLRINYKGLPRAIICDLDGTLALFDRDPYDASTCDQDDANPPVLETLNRFKRDHVILFVSGRMEKYRQQTLKFLNLKCNINWFNNHKLESNMYLYMRKDDDFRKDSIIKEEIYNEHIRDEYFVEFVLDDRDQTTKMWREKIGLTCFQVAEGNF